MKKLILLLLLIMLTTTVSAQKYVGGDISMLTKYEDAGVVYKDKNGTAVQPLPFFKEQGLNIMRVRLFVDPSKDNDKGVCQDLDYVKKLGKRIKDAGFNFMLDFHYSDTWADPAKQWTPNAWKTLSDTQLYDKIYEYTKECLQQLKTAGATPDFIQTGNEISYGMLWGKYGDSNPKKCYSNSPAANWTRFVALLEQAVKACREVCPDAQVVIHTERSGDASALKFIYDKLATIDYDVIGLSYYPFWHGSLTKLSQSLNQLEAQYPMKKVQIVETAYYYQWQPQVGNGIDYDFSSTWPATAEGQVSFVRDLVAELKKHSNVNALYWWFPEENGTGPDKAVIGGWLNRGLWDNNTHCALPALYELKSFFDGRTGIASVMADMDDSKWYTLRGVCLDSCPAFPGIYVRNRQKVAVR